MTAEMVQTFAVVLFLACWLASLAYAQQARNRRNRSGGGGGAGPQRRPRRGREVDAPAGPVTESRWSEIVGWHEVKRED